MITKESRVSYRFSHELWHWNIWPKANGFFHNLNPSPIVCSQSGIDKHGRPYLFHSDAKLDGCGNYEVIFRWWEPSNKPDVEVLEGNGREICIKILESLAAPCFRNDDFRPVVDFVLEQLKAKVMTTRNLCACGGSFKMQPLFTSVIEICSVCGRGRP